VEKQHVASLKKAAKAKAKAEIVRTAEALLAGVAAPMVL